MMKLKIYGVLIVVLFLIISLLVYLNQSSPPLPEEKPVMAQEINSFEECVTATNLVFTSNPTKCVAPDGQVFVDPLLYQGRVITEVEEVK